MSSFDRSPLFRTGIGFERAFRLLDGQARADQSGGYPPYNIEKTGADSYRISMAVAGFGMDDLSIVSQANRLTVSGKTKRDDAPIQYLYRGIATRSFERRFELADGVVVRGAHLVDGMLHVDLVREVPEALKPRSIPIAA